MLDFHLYRLSRMATNAKLLVFAWKRNLPFLNGHQLCLMAYRKARCPSARRRTFPKHDLFRLETRQSLEPPWRWYQKPRESVQLRSPCVHVISNWPTIPNSADCSAERCNFKPKTNQSTQYVSKRKLRNNSAAVILAVGRRSVHRLHQRKHLNYNKGKNVGRTQPGLYDTARARRWKYLSGRNRKLHYGSSQSEGSENWNKALAMLILGGSHYRQIPLATFYFV